MGLLEQLLNKQNIPHPIATLRGQKYINENPGLKNAYDFQNGLQIFNASHKRQALQQNNGGGYSEYFARGDKGNPNGLMNPSNGKKAVIEIYNKEAIKNPFLQHNLISAEILHGMDTDPNWQTLKQSFTQDFSPEVTVQNKRLFNTTPLWNDGGQSDFAPIYKGETYDQMMNRSGVPAYLRASIVPNLPNSNEWTSQLSPQQWADVGLMKNYLKSGKLQ